MELQLVRRLVVTRHKAGALAAVNDVAEWEAQFYGRIVEVETSLGSIGGTSGNTTVDVKKNGTSIFVAAPSIAFNAAQKRRRDSATTLLPVGTVGAAGNLTPTAGEPNGVDFAPGDLFRVDVTAIPGTASSDLTVDLHCIAKDV
jgi:hypothetical protein